MKPQSNICHVYGVGCLC